MEKALLWEKGEIIACGLCHHFCKIKSGRTGFCGARKNIDSELFSLNYGQVVSQNIDPIEKKPLFRFLPKTLTYSLACWGCNFHCLNCQNWEISQIKNPALKEIKPERIVAQAVLAKCPSISYTYAEPTIFFEFALDCMKLARKNGLKNIWVSNGFMSSICLAAIKPYLDAVNIDLKFFKDESYRRVCGGRLSPVLDNIVWFQKNKIHLEITTLIIPSLNDSEEELKNIAEFIARLDPEIPWHVSAYHPAYKSDLPPAPLSLLQKARQSGKEAGLKHIYLGNV